MKNDVGQVLALLIFAGLVLLVAVLAVAATGGNITW